jgi:hypothetical protein
MASVGTFCPVSHWSSPFAASKSAVSARVRVGSFDDQGDRRSNPRRVRVGAQRDDRVGTSGNRQNGPTTARRCKTVFHTAIWFLRLSAGERPAARS